MNYTKIMRSIEEQRNMIERIKYINENDMQFKNIVIFLSMIQKNDGSFSLINKYKVPNDIKVYFCDEVSYICTSIYIKAYNFDKEWFNNTIGQKKLKFALKYCSLNKLRGHGYDALNSQLKAMKCFIINGIKIFLIDNNSICNDFSNMFYEIIRNYKLKINHNDYLFGFSNYEKEIKEVISLYKKENIKTNLNMLDEDIEKYLINFGKGGN